MTKIRQILSPKFEVPSPVKKSARNLPPSYSSTYQPIENIFGNGPQKSISSIVLPNKTTNVLLLSASRSGGSFLGQLLNSVAPDTFYVFDPVIIAAQYQVIFCIFFLFLIICNDTSQVIIILD